MLCLIQMWKMQPHSRNLFLWTLFLSEFQSWVGVKNIKSQQIREDNQWEVRNDNLQRGEEEGVWEVTFLIFSLYHTQNFRVGVRAGNGKVSFSKLRMWKNRSPKVGNSYLGCFTCYNYSKPTVNTPSRLQGSGGRCHHFPLPLPPLGGFQLLHNLQLATKPSPSARL